MLIRLRGCAGWSALLLFAYGIRHIFAWPGPSNKLKLLRPQTMVKSFFSYGGYKRHTWLLRHNISIKILFSMNVQESMSFIALINCVTNHRCRILLDSVTAALWHQRSTMVMKPTWSATRKQIRSCDTFSVSNVFYGIPTASPGLGSFQMIYILLLFIEHRSVLLCLSNVWFLGFIFFSLFYMYNIHVCACPLPRNMFPYRI